MNLKYQFNNLRKSAVALMAFASILFLTACGGSSDSEGTEATAEAMEEMGSDNTEMNGDADASEEVYQEEGTEDAKVTVCLWDELSVREEPADKGKYKTVIYLGEKVTFLDEKKTDDASSKKNVYLKIKLSDGTEGWVQERMMAANVKEFVTINEAKIYKRPDYLTVTDKSFPAKLYVVAAEADQDGFYKVKAKPYGSTWFTEGWVSGKDLTDMQEDLAFGKMYGRAMQIKDEAKRKAQIKVIMETPQLQSSVFVDNNSNGNRNDVGVGSGPELTLSTTLETRQAYECWLQGSECFTDTKNFETINVGGVPRGMFAEGINGIFSYTGLLSCFSKYGEGMDSEQGYDWWGEGKYTLLKTLSGGIDPTLKRGYNYQSNKPSDHGFDHLNPKYINWAVTNLIPEPSDGIAGLKAQKIYDKVMARFFRLHVRAYLYVANAGWDQEKMAYKMMQENENNVYLVTALDNRYNDKFNSVYRSVPNDEYYSELTSGIAAGFWIRRDMDGTRDEVWGGLLKAMKVYDGEWLEGELMNWQ